MTEQTEKEFDAYILSIRSDCISRLSKLPSSNDITYVEPRVRQLHYEIRMAICFGLHETAIQNCGILAERFLRDLYYSRVKKECDNEFAQLISKCFKMGIIHKKEREYLDTLREKVRNQYVHSRFDKITAGMGVRGRTVKFNSEKPDEMRKQLEDAAKTPLTDENSEIFRTENNRPLQDILISDIVKKQSAYLFISLDEFIRNKAKEIETGKFEDLTPTSKD